MTETDVKSYRQVFVIALLVLLFTAGCTSTVSTNGSKLAEITKGHKFDGSKSANSAFGGTQLDMAAQEVIANGCLDAWRTELKGNEDLAMEKLEKLAKSYPDAVTIQFMMGQVKEHAGKTKEAIEFYREAVEKSGLSSMALFKLAEALRTTGDADLALKRYRELLKQSPGFVPAQIGLAQVLIEKDANSKEARALIEAVLEKEPANEKAMETARKIGMR